MTGPRTGGMSTDSSSFGVKQRLRIAFDRFFAPRELLWRSGDRVRCLRLSPVLQKGLFATALVGLGWLVFASGGYVAQRGTLAEKDREIAEARLAYLDLLAEVSNYHSQFSEITTALEQNQALLLSLLESGEESIDAAELSGQILGSEAARAEMIMARDALRRHLRNFETDLKDIAGRNETLRTQIAALKSNLAESEAERAEVDAAREALRTRLRETEQNLEVERRRTVALESSLAALAGDHERSQQALEVMTSTRDLLAREVAALQDTLALAGAKESQLAERIERLSGELTLARGESGQLQAQRDDLAGKLAEAEAALATVADRARTLLAAGAGTTVANGLEAGDLEQRRAALLGTMEATRVALAAADTREATLQAHIETLDGRLAEVVAEARGLAEQRDLLQLRLTGAHQRLAEQRDLHQSVVGGLHDRARFAVSTIEDALTLTGLDLDGLLTANREVASSSSTTPADQGGPFEAAALPGDPHADLWQTSVGALQGSLRRWEELRLLMIAMPLSSPVDQYRISSGYGRRKDPFNGRMAMHKGIDLAAPSRTPVLSPAPGKVVYAGWKSGYGRFVEIDHGYGLRTRYGHLRSITVKTGQTVGYRDKVGRIGSSGRSTGPHVHYEILFNGETLDPKNFLEAGMFLKGKKKRQGGGGQPAAGAAQTRDASQPSTPGKRQPSGVPSIISADLRIEGNLYSEGDIQVDGAVTGDIVSRTLTLGEGSEVRGAVSSESVRVCGAVAGELRARSIVLTKTAKVMGDVVHESLAIEAGAFLHGHCRRLELEDSALVGPESLVQETPVADATAEADTTEPAPAAPDEAAAADLGEDTAAPELRKAVAE